MPVLLPLFFLLLSAVSASPPILSQPLTAQLTPDNPAVSSAFLIPPTSALLVNTSSPYPALRVPPSWSFSVGFSGTTFQPPPHGSQELVYTAQLDSGDPLPDWLVFADDTITFGGVTPKESVGIQVLRIVVTAATDANMTTSDTFTLIVCSHDLSLSGGPLLTRNITATSPFTLPLTDFTGVLLDGAPPTSQTLSDSSNLTLALDLTAFPWLSYDPSSCTVSGTPPADAHPHAPLPPIPARVTLELPGTTQTLSVATNVTLMVMPSVFTAGTLPALQAPPETQIAFALAPFLTGTVNPRRRRADTDAYTNLNANPPPNTHITAAWTPSNASFLSFDPTRLLLTGTVPASSSAPSKIQVTFQALDTASNTTSTALMRINVDGAGTGGDSGGRSGVVPGNEAVRSAGGKIKLAVGVVFGVAAGIIVLACLLAVCRHCCAAHEHVSGAYVIDQTDFGRKGSITKEKAVVDAYPAADVNYATDATVTTYFAPGEELQGTGPHTMTKAAFFDAVRARFGSDGSWRGSPRNRNRSVSGGTTMNVPGIGNAKEKAKSFFSTINSIGSRSAGSRFGTGQRAGSGSGRTRKSKISRPMALLSSSTSVREGFAGGRANGNRDGRGGIVPGARARGTNFTLFGEVDGVPLPPLPPHPNQQSHNNNTLTPPPLSSPGTAVLAYDRSRSVSDPARGSVVSDGAGGNGKRGSGSASAPSLGTATHTHTTRSGTQSTFLTGDADSTWRTNGAGEVPLRRPGFDGRWETLKERQARVAAAAGQAQRPFLPPKALMKGASGVRTRTPSPPNAFASGSGTGSASGGKGASERSLAVPSSYHNVFYNGKDHDHPHNGLEDASSESDDADSAVITHVVNRSSSETAVLVNPKPSSSTTTGKPRLVAFTHARTAIPGAGSVRRDVSQKAVMGGEEGGDLSDGEEEMRMGLEYVRRLGGEEEQGREQDEPTAEYYASNDSNNSIAGRARVLAPLAPLSHRSRRFTPQGQVQSASASQSQFQSTSRQSRLQAPSHFTFRPQEPFNFAVPVDRAQAGSALQARQSDGRALPEWLRFERGGKEFWGVAPRRRGERVVVDVQVWDGETGAVVGGCIVEVVEEE